jgi:hypothetical protein
MAKVDKIIQLRFLLLILLLDPYNIVFVLFFHISIHLFLLMILLCCSTMTANTYISAIKLCIYVQIGDIGVINVPLTDMKNRLPIALLNFRAKLPTFAL